MAENEHSISSVALWGPPGTGKSWYVYSFAKKLQEYRDDNNFIYKLMRVENDSQKFPVDNVLTPPATLPTEDATDLIWEFQREAKDKSNLAQTISAQVHRIHVHDDAGKNVIELNNKARINLKNANALLLMLDPTSLVSYRGRGSSNSSASDSAAIYEPHEYATMVQELMQVLTSSPSTKRYIAVCITKVDQLGVKKRDPWELIEMFFERGMYNVLSTYRDSQNVLMQTFSVSASGYYTDKSELKPNFDTLSGKIVKPDEWKPYNVEFPVFWLAEQIERNRIIQSTQQGSFLGKMLFSTDRSNQYIGYPIERR